MESNLMVGLLIGLLAGGGLVAVVLWLVLKPRTEAEYERLRTETTETRNAAEREAKSIITNYPPPCRPAISSTMPMGKSTGWRITLPDF
jgi:hypothetical protein